MNHSNIRIANTSKYIGSLGAQLDVSNYASTSALVSYDSVAGFQQFLAHVYYNNQKNFQLSADFIYKQDCSTPISGSGIASLYLSVLIHAGFFYIYIYI
jgi:hypothetical protein